MTNPIGPSDHNASDWFAMNLASKPQEVPFIVNAN